MDQGNDTHQERIRQVDEPRRGSYQLPHIHDCFLSAAVRALDTRLKGSRFNSQTLHYQVTTLGKLFTPTCLCRCMRLVIGVDS